MPRYVIKRSLHTLSLSLFSPKSDELFAQWFARLIMG